MTAQRYPDFSRLSGEILRPRLPRIGQIKIGRKGRLMTSRRGKEFRPPEKLDHFLITKRTRDPKTDNYVRDDTIHARIGDKPVELDVMLMFNEPEQNFQTSLVAYSGRSLMCQGNGQRAFDRQLGKDIPCTCPLLKQHEGGYDGPARPVGKVVCKPSGVLSVLLKAADTYGGFYTLRTTSWETISSITAALDQFKRDFGVLAYLPMRLVLYPSTDTYEEGGEQKTSTSYKVGLVLAGGIDTAIQIASDRQERRQRLLQLSSGEATYTPEEHVEQLREIAREDEGDVAAEFYPEAIDDSAGNADAVDADYEIVEDDEGDADDSDDGFPLRAICRRTMELAGFDRIRINNAFERQSLAAIAIELEEKRPDQWNQARTQVEAEAAAAAQTVDVESDAADPSVKAGAEPDPGAATASAEAAPGGSTAPADPAAATGTMLDLFGG